MSNSSADSSDLFSRESRRWETILAEFESALFRGERPDIADYLAGNNDQQSALLLELVHVDLEIRLKRGAAVRVENYLGRFPQLANTPEQLIELVLFEYELRKRSESISSAEYLGRFPEIASQIIEHLSDTDVVSDAPDAKLAKQVKTAPVSDRRVSLSIQVISGPHRGVVYETEQHSTILVGRGGEAQLQLSDDPHFSRFHFRLEMAPPDCRLIDLNSSNGTYVNGRRMETGCIRDGDVISGGTTRILVSIHHAQVAGAPDSSHPGAVHANLSANEGQQTIAPLPAVPGYEIQHLIGMGTIGAVYRALHIETGDLAAVKLIRAPRAGTRSGMLQFIQHMNRLAALQHPGIVALREAGVVDDRPFVVTDYIEALSFSDVLSAEKQSARDRLACRIVSRILDALEFVHQQSMIHGNIKPANILLGATRRRLSIQLCDIGIAMQWIDSNLSSIGVAPDRPEQLAFMAPEQIRDCRHAGPAVDIYSTGMLLYHLLSGSIPFDCSSEQLLFDQILTGQRVPLESHRSEIPPRLIAVIDHAMQHSPRDRFTDAGEMRDELHEFSER